MFHCAISLPLSNGSCRFYISVTIVGLVISATISGLSQGGSTAGLNPAPGGNPFSIYLLFSMTISMFICGQMLRGYNAWLESQTVQQQERPRQGAALPEWTYMGNLSTESRHPVAA